MKNKPKQQPSASNPRQETPPTEEQLLAMLEDAEANHQVARWELMNHYRRIGEPLVAAQYAMEFLDHAANPEAIAVGYLKLGQIMEQIEDFESAVRFYAQGLQAEPSEKEVWYWLHNNTGYSLNQLGRHEDAEWYCGEAIRIDSRRHNAYKNLGVALEGQRCYVEAAKCYIIAVKLGALDPRALGHLENLVCGHEDEITLEIPDLQEELQ